MKIFYAVVLFTMFLGGGTLSFGSPVAAIAQSSGVQGDVHIEKEFKSAMGRELDIDLGAGGSIDIAGWDNDLITVRAELGGRDGRSSKVDFNESATGLQIRSSYTGDGRNYSASIKFVIRVPRQTSLKIKSIGGGIRIDNVSGVITGETMGGALHLSRLAGKINLTTMGGSINLTDSEVDGSVETMGGHVSIQHVNGNIKGWTAGGKVVYSDVTGHGQD